MAVEQRFASFREVEHEHCGLNRDMAILQSALMREIEDDDFMDWRLQFLWQLRDFKNRLLKHFDLEEIGGFMSEVLELKPELKVKVAELRQEHHDISAWIDRAVTELKSMDDYQEVRMEAVRDTINELMVMLHKHENSEHRLLQQAYYRDYGGPA